MKLIFLFIFLSLPSLFFAQEKQNTWEKFHEEQGLRFYKKLSDCNLPEQGLYAKYYLVKIENTSITDLEVQWKNRIYYNNQCVSCHENYYPAPIKIEAKSTIEGQCGLASDRNLKVFDSWTQLKNKRKLTDYYVRDIKIKEVNRD